MEPIYLSHTQFYSYYLFSTMPPISASDTPIDYLTCISNSPTHTHTRGN